LLLFLKINLYFNNYKYIYLMSSISVIIENMDASASRSVSKSDILKRKNAVSRIKEKFET
jgi:hypothetical protein